MTVQSSGSAVPESAWFKSSYSGGGGGECVEVATTCDSVHVRDSKDLAGPIVRVSPEAWTGLVALAATRLV
ncbi:DUF397 domain-containing protein [Streptomyces sp. NBC_00091]|uniref:DUF397 domain-containing protein n=1 Tax=Streptomyces sp. NBC_00091 TaxID=2975648 RepID=UPI002254C19C|nr:DUF397 domain-containing protein [Streptomyces sp. NBC_00091]MCX5375849.1 DUF397 domain-containing protein [Streptomyces sp. NBC_00091]